MQKAFRAEDQAAFKQKSPEQQELGLRGAADLLDIEQMENTFKMMDTAILVSERKQQEQEQRDEKQRGQQTKLEQQQREREQQYREEDQQEKVHQRREEEVLLLKGRAETLINTGLFDNAAEGEVEQKKAPENNTARGDTMKFDVITMEDEKKRREMESKDNLKTHDIQGLSAKLLHHSAILTQQQPQLSSSKPEKKHVRSSLFSLTLISLLPLCHCTSTFPCPLLLPYSVLLPSPFHYPFPSLQPPSSL